MTKSGFKCSYCQGWVITSKSIGTRNRNHCPICLWSKHVDDQKPGDRKSTCRAVMEPKGLTFKKEGIDKYGQERQGEIMLIHKCAGCGKFSINRIAADDNASRILELLDDPSGAHLEDKPGLEKAGILLLTKDSRQQVNLQLYGC